jgi:cytochrome c oxidase accessory protein FixG
MTSSSTTHTANSSDGEGLSTLQSDGQRRWLYPTLDHGRLRKARMVVGWSLIALFVALPVVEIGGRPAILLDVYDWRFHLFGWTFHPTDTVFLMLLLLSSLMTVGFLTALVGRVWCGWGCPQTVYLEFVYRPIERWIEGSAVERKRLDEREMDGDKFLKKSAKYAAYLVVTLLIAHTFVAYFVGWERLTGWMTDSPTAHPGVFVMMAGTSALMLFDFGWFREQMCTTVCPYAKLQSVLLDKDSMIVSYDPNRGEPRGRRNREQMKQEKQGVELALGDCIDCGACVRTCPTGIDIRDGLQMECVNCTQCIDACNDVMRSIDKPEGLIRFTSERALEDDETNIIRPRVLVYGALLAICLGVFGYMLANLPSVEATARLASSNEYRMIDSEQAVANQVSITVRNRKSADQSFVVSVTSPDGASFRGQGSMKVSAGEFERTTGWIMAPAARFSEAGRASATVDIKQGSETITSTTVNLLGPRRVGTGGSSDNPSP